jgi:hypothetical protein
MELLWLLGPGLGILWTAGYSFLWSAPVVYIVLRWQAHHEGDAPDPQLGLKILLCFFRSLALHTALAGAGFIVYGLMPDTRYEPSFRIGCPLLIAGGLVSILHDGVVRRWTNSAARPTVAKTFAGIGLAMTGLIGFGALASLLLFAFQKIHVGEGLNISLAVALVALPTWAVHGIRFVRRYGGSTP